MNRAEAPADGGFTLVEALVSLFVFALVAAGGSAMLMQSVTAQRDVGAAHESLRALQTTRALLAADLSQVAPRAPRLGEDVHAEPFVGGAPDAAMALVRAAPAMQSRLPEMNALVRVIYVVDGDRLVRRVLRQVDGAPETGEERVLLDHAQDVHVTFFDGVRWLDQWNAPGAPPPRAVAVTARLPRYGVVRLETYVGVGQ